MSTLNTLIATQTTNIAQATITASCLDLWVTNPPALAADASVWFGALRTLAIAASLAEASLNAVQLAAEDSVAVIAMTAGELSMAEHMKEALYVTMRKAVAQNNLDCQAVYSEWRATAGVFKAS